MSHYTLLRSILRHSVLAAMAIQGGACCGDYPPETLDVRLEPNIKWDALQQNCHEDATDCEPLCTAVLSEFNPEVAYLGRIVECELDDQTPPVLHIEYTDGTVCGRRPMQSAGPTSSDCSEAGYFEQAARLEAASVCAFWEMAIQLRAFGAPQPLIDRCKNAAHEEVRHALWTAAIARRLANNPDLLPELKHSEQIWRDAHAACKQEQVSLIEFAVHNAVEGCVGESFGAAVALWQAGHSTESWIRSILTQIAADETSHAALSWDLDVWCRLRCNDEERAHLLRMKHAAGRELWQGVVRNDEHVGGAAGLPNTVCSRQILGTMGEMMWG